MLRLLPAYLLGTLLIFMGLLQGCSKEAEPEAKPRPVKYIQLLDASGSSKRSLPGKIKATDQVDLAFQVDGQLIDFPIIKGQNVETGDLLGRIDPSNYQSTANARQADYIRASKDYERGLEILKKQFISQAEADKLKAIRDIANAELEKAKKDLADTQLYAPFSGSIANTFVDNFQDVRAKQAVLSLQNAAQLHISVNVPERAVALNGDKLDEFRFTAEFDAVKDKEFPVAIYEFATVADSKTQTFEYVFAMDRPEGINILPGMSVNIIAYRDVPASAQSIESSATVFELPVAAVFSDRTGNEQQYVWVIDPIEMTVHQQAIQIGQLVGNGIEVLSGLNADDYIVTAGANYLQENQVVTLLDNKIGG